MNNTKAKHTPGPWFYWSGQKEGELYGATIGASGFRPAKAIGENLEECEANARLIAAAPETAAERDRLKEINKDLLEALKEAEPALAVQASYRNNEQQRIQNALETVRAALNKAEPR